MPSLEARLCRLEEQMPSATLVRAYFAALRRLVISEGPTAEDAETFKAMSVALNDGQFERQLSGLTDDELCAGIDLLKGYIATKSVSGVPT